MAKLDPFQKRIKRRIIGRTHEFFAATAPGLEHLCLNELRSLPLEVSEATVISGGVQFQGRIHDGYLANLHLRTANRILMRIGSVAATNFRQLDKVLAEFPWELYLMPGERPHVEVAARQSRLYHSQAVADRFQSAISRRLTEHGPAAKPAVESPVPQRLFVRIQNDRFTLSMDSSGELLYKRGIKTHGGSAPIRETLAAAILALSGYREGLPLVDPMCGSGTFSIEAAMMAKGIPAGWYRDFAFARWPAFRPQRWEHIRREAAAHRRKLQAPMIFASDSDPENCRNLTTMIDACGFQDAVQVSHRDFFAFIPEELTERPGLVILNPPYGLRIGSPKDSDALFRNICRHLKTAYRGWQVALIAPGRHLVRHVPFPAFSHELVHGGLHLDLLVGRIP